MSAAALMVVPHRVWGCLLEHRQADGEVSSQVHLSGGQEPRLKGVAPDLEGVPLGEVTLLALALDAALQTLGPQPKRPRPGSLEVVVVVPEALAGDFLEHLQAAAPWPGLKTIQDWQATGRLRFALAEAPCEREHLRLTLEAPTRWTSHLLGADGARLELSGQVAPGSYPNLDKPGHPLVHVPVTVALLQVAMVKASLEEALSRSGQVTLLADTALRGALLLSWPDWERALATRLATTVAVAQPWLPGALAFLRQGREGLFTVQWLKTAEPADLDSTTVFEA